MSDTIEGLYLVPYDFTLATEDAFKYALDLVNLKGGSIILAHVARSRDDAYTAEVKLVEKIKDLSDETKPIVNYEVIVGSIYDDLDKICKTHPL